MIRSALISTLTLALAAIVAAAPAIAQTSGTSAQSSSTTQAQISRESANASTSSSLGSSSSLTMPSAAKPMCASLGASTTGSMGDSRECIPEPVSGVTNPVLPHAAGNAMDATGTFSSNPALSPTPNVGVDASVMSSTPGSSPSNQPGSK